MKFALLIYPGVEPIDLAPLGVLSMARRLEPSISCCTIARASGETLLSNGLKVIADHALSKAPDLDVVIVAGGPGWVEESQQQETLEFLKEIASRAQIMSICTGAMILANSGLLSGRKATTKREVVPPEEAPIAVMRREHRDIEVVEASLVDGGTIITAGGVSLCIDATLYLLEKCYGVTLAAETARIMEYHRAWDANKNNFRAEHDDLERQPSGREPQRA
jgi:transcriptional regulator GlxA family with amidase domain